MDKLIYYTDFCTETGILKIIKETKNHIVAKYLDNDPHEMKFRKSDNEQINGIPTKRKYMMSKTEYEKSLELAKQRNYKIYDKST
jgi:ribosomal protein L11 methylase PrmA